MRTKGRPDRSTGASLQGRRRGSWAPATFHKMLEQKALHDDAAVQRRRSSATLLRDRNSERAPVEIRPLIVPGIR